MRFKKSLLLICLIICIFTMASVSATDANDTAIATTEDNLEINQATDDVIGMAEDKELASSGTNEVLKADEQTFSQLNATINGNTDNNIYLTSDYKYSSGDDSFKEGIVIDRDVNIYGNGHTINGSGEARIFKIKGGNVVFYNITFVNGDASNNEEDSGGAINGNCKPINCTFKENHASLDGGAMSGGSAVNCIFTGNHANNFGGAMCDGSAVNCTFTDNSAFGGGAMFGGSAVNCSFTGNHADYEGGAMCGGSAVNCSFRGNHAVFGGAMGGGSAVNCSFRGNHADEGGAMAYGSAVNCTFTDNSANHGGALSDGSAVNCTFTDNSANHGGAMYDGYKAVCSGQYPDDFYGTEELALHWEANDFTIICGSGETLPIKLRNQNDKLIAFINYDVVIYNKNDVVKTCHCLSNDELSLDLPLGAYTAELIVTCPGLTQTERRNITLTVTTDGTTFWDLNHTINGNTNDTITLDKNYSFNPAVDSDFINGIVINRNVTIDGNGYTLNGLKQARIFNVIGENVIFKNINFINGNAENGGAIYGGSVSINCNFTNNTAGSKEMTSSSMGYGGAICYGLAINCTFQNNNALQTSEGFIGDGNGGAIIGDAINCTFIGNHASWSGGAIYHGNADNCTFIRNSAGFGGAINDGNAKICIFIQNKAYEYGDAMYRGTAILCIFDRNDYKTEIIPAYLNASNLTSTFNSGEKLPFNLTANNTNYYGFNITITIFKDGQPAGTYYALSGEDFPVNLTPGIYKVVLSLDRYEGVVNGEITLTINKANSTLTINNVTFDYGTSGSATVAFTNATGFVADVIGQPNAVVSVVNDTITVSGLDAGNYTLSVTTITDGNHNNITKNATIIVNKLQTQLTGNAITATYNINKDLVITLKDANGKALSGVKVTVKLKGTKTYITDKNGQVKISTKGLAPKKYTAKITFNGDKNYAKSTKDVKVTVKKAKAKIFAKKKTYKANKKTKKFKITLKDKNGKPIKKAKVRLIVKKIKKTSKKKTSKKDKNKKKNIKKTNKKGKITFKIKRNKKGKYMATVKFYGNKYYAKAVKKVKIKMK